jgi:hypothetical protein
VPPLDWLLIALLAAVVLVGLPWVLGPALILAVARYGVDPEFDPIDPDELSEPVLAYLDAGARQLETLGFRELTWLTMRGFAPRMVSHFAVLLHDDGRVAAMVAVIEAGSDGATRLQAKFLELCTLLPDGRHVCTSNSGELLPPVPVPGRVAIQLPRVEDPGRLLHLHRGLVTLESGSGRGSAAAIRDDVEAFLRQCIVIQVDALVDAGLMRRPGADGQSRPTLKGAFILTWSMLWPASAVRRTRRDRRTAALVARLEPPAAAPGPGPAA